MGISQASGGEADRESPPWAYSTVPAFACVAAVFVGSALSVIALVVRDHSAGKRLSCGELIFMGVTVVSGLAFPMVLVRLRVSGRWTILADGIEYRPVLHAARRVRWDEVESVQWLRWRLVLRGHGQEVVIRWAELPPRVRDSAREWVRSSLAPAFQLTDAQRPLERTAWPRIIVVSMITACPMLLAWDRLLHDFYGNRNWIWVFFSPLPLSFLLAFANAYRERNRFSIWYHRRRDLAGPADPPRPRPAVLS